MNVPIHRLASGIKAAYISKRPAVVSERPAVGSDALFWCAGQAVLDDFHRPGTLGSPALRTGALRFEFENTP